MPTKSINRPVRTDADLYRLWTELMGPGGFGRRTLWLVFLRPDGVPTGVIVPLEDIPVEPHPLFVRNVKLIVDGIGAEADVGSVPVLLSRPGPSGMIGSDRRWAVALRTEAPRELTCWPMHLATTDRIQVFAPDDLVAAS